MQEGLDALRQVAEGDGEGLMVAIVECARRRCTLGEISDCLRSVFGEYHEA